MLANADVASGRERRPRALAGLTHDAPIGSQAQIGKPLLSVSLSRRVPSQTWNAARWLIYFRMLGYYLQWLLNRQLLRYNPWSDLTVNVFSSRQSLQVKHVLADSAQHPTGRAVLPA